MKKRVGVFVCDCGTNIASVVDTEKVAAAARQFPGVVCHYLQIHVLDPGQELVRNAIGAGVGTSSDSFLFAAHA